MKRTFLTLAAAVWCCGAVAQQKALHYNAGGDFRIVQFTDNHYKPGDPASERAVELVREVLAAETPDLVVFTGDLAWAPPAREAFDRVLAPVVESGTPWAFVIGNHDDEFDLSRRQVMDYIVQKPGCLARAGERHLKGVGNYVLEVKAHGTDSVANVLYFMDSGAYSQIPGVGGYDWLGRDQIGWYAAQSRAYTRANGGKPLPSLAFFHIPLYEYSLMAAAEGTLLVGSREEQECNGRINSGMFAAMLECGDVMGTFVGHDHDNDYIGDYYGIALAYGRYSGGNTVYNNLGTIGCRVIELREGVRGFTTYIRLSGGEKIHPVDFPGTFRKTETGK